MSIPKNNTTGKNTTHADSIPAVSSAATAEGNLRHAKDSMMLDSCLGMQVLRANVTCRSSNMDTHHIPIMMPEDKRLTSGLKKKYKNKRIPAKDTTKKLWMFNGQNRLNFFAGQTGTVSP